MKQHHAIRLLLATVLPLTAAALSVAQTARDASPTATEADESTVVLSPFHVDASKDHGYRATNTVTGTRLNAPLKNVPMNIDVITGQFIQDIGATNLREALQFQSGLVLESQADAFVEVEADPQGAGANDPRGVTRRPGSSSTKSRGMISDQMLREGFRRQHFADAVNIERVEYLRGPSALLYGIGNFGGVVNYIPKKPQLAPHYSGGVTVGTNELYRAEFDATGPLGNSDWDPAYRVTGAVQENGDHTDYYKQKYFTVAPSFSFRPLPNTYVLLDNEFGDLEQTGVGFQNIRANINAGASRTANWLTDTSNGVIDTRTFRWSGPDTYLKGPFQNHILDVQQKVGDDLWIRAGYGYSRVVSDSRQIRNTSVRTQPFSLTDYRSYYETPTVSINGTSVNLREAIRLANQNGTFGGLTATQIAALRTPGSFRGDRLYAFVANDPIQNQVIPGPPSTTSSGVIRYEWIDYNKEEERHQVRADVNYSKDLGRWGKHSFLLGVQYQEMQSDEEEFGPPYSYANNSVDDVVRYSFKSPGDYSPFRYGVQGDGLADAPRVKRNTFDKRTWDVGYFGVYQGQFWNERITLIGGLRWDRSDAREVQNYIHEVGRAPTERNRAQFAEDAPTATSPQVGLNFRINDSLSVFGLYSTGVVPNYYSYDGNGDLFAPTKAKNYEAGVKFDLLDGRISGTASLFRIERENTPRFLWWAPSPYESLKKGWDPNKPNTTVWWHAGPESVWYAMKNAGGVDVAKKIFPQSWWSTLEAMAAIPANATNPKNPGTGFSSIPGVARWWSYDLDANGHRGLTRDAEVNTGNSNYMGDRYFPLLNMNDPAVATFVNAAKNESGNWGGNFYYTSGQVYRYGDGGTGTGNAPDGSGASVGLNDKANGFDLSMVVSPMTNLQFVASYSYLKREITSPTYQFVSAPYWPLGWWYAQDGFFGTLGYNRTVAEAYADPTDTTTYRAPIPDYQQSADDSPKHNATFWARYTLDEIVPVKGITVGVGGKWESRRQWFTGFTGGGGNFTTVTNPSGERVLVQLWTPERLTINAFAEYRFMINERYRTRVALNVDNLLDDQSRYGVIYAPGVSYRLRVGVDF